MFAKFGKAQKPYLVLIFNKQWLFILGGGMGHIFALKRWRRGLDHLL